PSVYFGSGLRLPRLTLSTHEEVVQLNHKLRHGGSGQTPAWTMHGLLTKPLARRLAVNFDLPLRGQDEPDLLDVGAGVGAEFGAVVLVAAHADLDDQFR